MKHSLLALALVAALGFALAAQTITQGAMTTWYLTTAASTNSTLLNAGPASVFGVTAINTTATIYYIRFYNLASAPTCSSATGFVESLPIPASTTGAGFQRTNSAGQSFPVGLGYCITGGGGSTDNTNAATGVYVSVIGRVGAF